MPTLGDVLEHHDDPKVQKAFERYAVSKDRSLRNQLVEVNLGLAYHLTQRYEGKGVESADLRQVAVVGLVKAVERFDHTRGVTFATFARPFIVGEMRHHFRDLGWELHVPRPTKERAQRVRRSVETLRSELGREPQVEDVAHDTGLTVDEVVDALDASRVTRTKRFEAGGSTGAPPEYMQPSSPDGGYLDVERRELLDGLLATLDERERHIVVARFVDEKSQQEIADEVGVSQVHVSRLLRKTLAQLQEQLRSTMRSPGSDPDPA